MVVIGILGNGTQCIGMLEEDGTLSNVYIIIIQPTPQGQQGIKCMLVPPFQPFDMEKSIPKVDSRFIMSTIPAPKELADVYTTRVTGIVMANPQDVANIIK